MAKNYVTNFRGECFFTPNEKPYIKDEPETPIEEDFGDHNVLDNSFESVYGSMKKSMSMSDISALRNDLAEINFNNKDDMYVRYKKPFGAPQELSKTKFVSMAEAIYHYQRDTPGRFHSSKPKFLKQPNSRLTLTVPQSPMLRSKTRARPVHIVSQQEKEEMELEEIKKFKIKAHPIPKSVIEGPIHLPDVHKKPPTIPEPFKITDLLKKTVQKTVQSPEHHQQFKARPAPKHILEKPQIPPKPPVQITKPTSPKFLHKRGNSYDQLKTHNKQHAHPTSATRKHVEKPPRHGPLQAEPFSFEKRDEEIKRRKEEWIKRQIEEEKKQASLFKAQPLPGVVKKHMHKLTAKVCSSTTSSENKENYMKFEARPPSVLYKEPFKPVLQPIQIKPMPFALTTEKRAVEREKFDQHLKEKEEEMERLRLEKEKKQQEEEERIKAEMRARLVHHAKPAPIPTLFVPQKSVAPITVPETPKFVRRLKQNQQ